MSTIKIKKVETRKDLERFIDFHYDLYKDNEYDVPTLFSDDLNTLSKDKNAAFEFSEAEYFMAFDGRGRMVGRVAAIINHRANKRWGRKCVRFGWIDFIDDINVSKALFDAVEKYGKSKGMEEMIGPLGFTDLDPEGMLTMGFDQLGTMATIYNYPYYPEHMEKLGDFEKDNDYVEFKLMVPDKVPEKYTKIAEMIQKRYDLHIRKLTKKDVFEGGYGKKMFELINTCFKDLYGYSELSERQIDQYIKMYFPLADLSLITVVEDRSADNKPVAVGITIPSLSKALQKCRHGRLWPFGWWHVLRALKAHKTEGVDLLLLGVLPEYRMKGANALMFYDLIPRYQAYGFKWGESQVEMETNENVQSQWQYLETILHKRRRCYKKWI
ncbi:N-acetyltransferase [uncultured Prevotella sp.]|uniref:N-acetyltransferase n=1 Tax=uncultured Prevotella sp. TaxID=159272 RepID=UPI00267690C8|nr:N-acetyltransferase [uncultured Prevotella sp.]